MNMQSDETNTKSQAETSKYAKWDQDRKTHLSDMKSRWAGVLDDGNAFVSIGILKVKESVTENSKQKENQDKV